MYLCTYVCMHAETLATFDMRMKTMTMFLEHRNSEDYFLKIINSQKV